MALTCRPTTPLVFYFNAIGVTPVSQRLKIENSPCLGIGKMNIFSSISMIKYVGRVFGCVELSTSKLFYEYEHPYDVECSTATE